MGSIPIRGIDIFLSLFYSCCRLYVAALRRVNLPLKVSYRLYIIHKLHEYNRGQGSSGTMPVDYYYHYQQVRSWSSTVMEH
jgi:hypothetical protein